MKLPSLENLLSSGSASFCVFSGSVFLLVPAAAAGLVCWYFKLLDMVKNRIDFLVQINWDNWKYSSSLQYTYNYVCPLSSHIKMMHMSEPMCYLFIAFIYVLIYVPCTGNSVMIKLNPLEISINGIDLKTGTLYNNIIVLWFEWHKHTHNIRSWLYL